MSQLTDREQEIAAQLKSADLGDIAGDGVNFQSLGFKDGLVSKEGAETHSVMSDITQVAYKVMKNRASDLSKAKENMNDVATRFGRDTANYSKAQSEYDEALVESKDAELRHDLSKNTKEVVGQATVRGMTF